MIRNPLLSYICGTALIQVLAVVGWAQSFASSATLQEFTEEPSVFRTNADLVLIDVVVRERKLERPVPGLKEPEFHIFEDGRPQVITVFEEHRAADAIQVSQHAVLPTDVYSNFPQYAVASAANVLLLDALNTPVNDQKYARAQMIKCLHTIPPGTQVAVFVLASRLQMLSGFTSDPGAIETAIAGDGSRAERSPSPDAALRASSGEMSNVDAGRAAQTAATQQVFSSEMRTFATDVRVRVTIAAMEQLARYLSTIPGRKNLIWSSASFPINLNPDSSHLDADGAYNYGTALREMDEQLARARVSVYPVDARALMTLPSANPANDPDPAKNPGVSQQLSLQGAAVQGFSMDVEKPQTWWESHVTMQQIAEETGGQAYYDTNAVGQSVASAIADGSNYYTLGYVPTNHNYNGEYRKVEVRLDERDYALSYRRGYDAVDPEKPDKTAKLSAFAGAMLHGSPPLSQIIFEVRVTPAGNPALRGEMRGSRNRVEKPPKKPVTRYILEYSIDPHHVALKELPDGRRQAEVEVAQAVYDVDGKRVKYSDTGLEVDLTVQELARALRQGIPVHDGIDLPAGGVYLRIGVRDVISGRLGTVEIPVGAK